MITFDHDPKVTDALKNWRGKDVFPTDLGHADLRGMARGIKRRAFFMARGTNAHFLQEGLEVIDGIISGKINEATGRWRLMKKAKELGYDPARGFPDDVAKVPPAERDSLQDLSSERRLNLVLQTNLRMAYNYGKMLAGHQPYALREYPAWELVRLYPRTIERGERRGAGGAVVPDPENGWPRRWAAAAESVSGWGVARGSRMVAAKLSGVWAALGDGAGGYTDTLDNPYPPFAFQSGMGWKAISRAEWAGLADDREPKTALVKATLAPTPKTAEKVYRGLADDMKAELAKELADLDLEGVSL